MEEFKDVCLGIDVRSEEIAADYTLAERYRQIDQEIYEMEKRFKT